MEGRGLQLWRLKPEFESRLCYLCARASGVGHTTSLSLFLRLWNRQGQ